MLKNERAAIAVVILTAIALVWVIALIGGLGFSIQTCKGCQPTWTPAPYSTISPGEIGAVAGAVAAAAGR